MAQNPLLGSRISLVSKKNIRYEGTLYSINETNATVALQNVRSFGTEGREAADPSTTFVAPQDDVHPYLLFRGCDIKDLHVHERASAEPPTDDPAVVSNGAATSSEDGAATPAQPSIPPPPETTNKNAASTSSAPPKPAGSKASEKNEKENQGQSQQQQQRPKQQNNKGGRGAGNNNNNRRPRKQNPASQVGTGASLLNRKARGTVEGGTGPEMNNEDFDFQSKLEEFNKEDEDDDAGDSPDVGGSYEKDDFFDSISCDALDRQSGVDNRLRGAQERSLNTETFGAVALNSQRRRRRGGGRGYGGRGGRGRGRGRGRGGRGRGRGRNNGRGAWGFNDNNTAPQAAAS